MEEKTITFPCECIEGPKECGYVRIIVSDIGIEFCWVKNKNVKKAKTGVIITKPKSIEIIKNLIK